MSENGLDVLLLQWEETYKKGLLSFWMMLLMAHRPTYAYEMSGEIARLSHGTIMADDNSIYRALRRFQAAGLVESITQPSESGPPRRYFRLTDAGLELLRAFIRRNVLVFQAGDVSEMIESAINDDHKGATS